MTETLTPSTETPTLGRTRILDLVGLVARLVLGGVLLYAGATKVLTPVGSARAVQAYQIFPFEVAQYIGYALPIVEIILGVLLILGLFTRTAAILGTVLMVLFIVGIASAWARGLTIDCGCFGGGGEVAPGETQYPRRIAEDVAFALCGLWLIVRPRSLLSLDRHLLRRP
ncbi:DoxX family membrane protein [Nostocoides sp. F2B08]|uniref:MauE/DoxX family redox-associated membrane protein n=1 Tax=Nostocoides sp. F2B08 TaxID=2653936 RepID=UPI001262C86B|nr:MauE/DoxX family redox-associated membrane protein [Tetrasphaera sp. F2B08]KAB7744575.1 DoxX family membrane protein [Tetrasphaera sp. F2B08]